jgi:hypothetical protein
MATSQPVRQEVVIPANMQRVLGTAFQGKVSITSVSNGVVVADRHAPENSGIVQ